jgi:conjugal transfer/entry exclusion protein
VRERERYSQPDRQREGERRKRERRESPHTQEAGIASKAPAAGAQLSSAPASEARRLSSLSALRRRRAAEEAAEAKSAAGLRVRGARKQFVDGAGDEQVLCSMACNTWHVLYGV